VKYTTNVQQTRLTDVHNNNLQSRIRMALAGTALAGALLAGGLFGIHGQATGAPAHANINHGATAAVAANTTQTFTRLNVTAQNNQTQAKTVALAYSDGNSYTSMAEQAALSAGISPDYFVRQIRQESGFNPNAGSPAGAEGIAQFMPGTAASMGVNPYDPSSALNGAAHMMASLSGQYGGDYAKALAAYNAGGGAVNAAVAEAGGNWLAHMPGETQNYVSIIMG
jgi:soluble lytic murein transglycosylase-like protein